MVSTEEHMDFKRDLYICENRPTCTNRDLACAGPALVAALETLKYEMRRAKETYRLPPLNSSFRGKTPRSQKRPTCTEKETYVYGKRPVWMKRETTDVSVRKKTYTQKTLDCLWYGVAPIGWLFTIIGLFCRISSLLQGSFAKETYHFKEPTNRSHPIRQETSKRDLLIRISSLL